MVCQCLSTFIRNLNVAHAYTSIWNINVNQTRIELYPMTLTSLSEYVNKG